MTTKRSSTAVEATATASAHAISPLRVIARESALIAAGTLALTLIGQLAIPLPFTPVPVTLGTFAALAVGAVLGSRRGVASALLLAGLAAAGAPVLAGWNAGVGVTFGYILGYALVADLAGRAARLWTRSAEMPLVRRTLLTFGAMAGAALVIFIPGVTWLKIATGVSWSTAAGLGFLPFLVGDVIKVMAVTALLPLRGRLH